jgi:PIN domain nuclease of toxin-antitoxin system
MTGVVSDTHSILWFLFDDRRLSRLAADVLQTTLAARDLIYIPSVCIVEATYLAEKGRVAAVAVERLVNAVRSPESGFRLAPLDLDVALRVQQIPREAVPDMPDRIIAATALALDCLW